MINELLCFAHGDKNAIFCILQAIRNKVDSNPVGALQELCQKVKVTPFYQEVVGAPRHTVQVTISPVLGV